MDGSRGYHTKWSKLNKDRQIHDIAYMWNLKKWYKWTYLDPNAGKDWEQEEKRATEGEMVGWHHQLNGHEFEQTQGG